MWVRKKKLKNLEDKNRELQSKVEDYEEILREFAKRLLNKKVGKRRNDCSSKRALKKRLRELDLIDEKDNIK